MKKTVLFILGFMFVVSLGFGQSGIFISEYSDTNVGVNYVYEFVEIYNNNNISIDVSNYILRQQNSTNSHTIASSTSIPANGFLIIGRNAAKTAFETYWGVSFGVDVTYVNSGDQCPLMNGDEHYLFEDNLGFNVDPPTDDEFSYLALVSGNRVYRLSIGNSAPDWTSDDYTNATPGSLEGGQVLPVNLSSFTATYIDGSSILNWTTQSENNNLGWNIYRGETETAFENNTSICLNNSGLIPGAGTTSEPTNYQFTDEYDVIVGQTYWYWLESIDGGGGTENYGPVTLTIFEEPVPELLQKSFLCSNYPNPFNPETKIEFSIKEGENGSLKIYNLKGQLLESYRYEAGEHELTWNATQYGSGIYFYKLETQSYTETKKMIMVK